MSIRNTLLAAALTLASLGTAAQANGLKPIEGRSVNLGDVSGVVYYTIEPDGFRFVTTLAEADKGTPIRFVSVLAPGQRALLSTPHQTGAVEISRNGDEITVRTANPLSN